MYFLSTVTWNPQPPVPNRPICTTGGNDDRAEVVELNCSSQSERAEAFSITVCDGKDGGMKSVGDRWIEGSKSAKGKVAKMCVRGSPSARLSGEAGVADIVRLGFAPSQVICTGKQSLEYWIARTRIMASLHEFWYLYYLHEALHGTPFCVFLVPSESVDILFVPLNTPSRPPHHQL